MPKRVGYLFQRPESRNWWIRFRNPRREMSLGTSDRREAEIKALPLIAEHKQRLLEARPRLQPGWRQDYEPGLHDGRNGERIAATDRELTFYDAEGRLLRITPNGRPVVELVNVPQGATLALGNQRYAGPPIDLSKLAPVAITARRTGSAIDLSKLERPPLAAKNVDDAAIETYIRHAGVTGYFERETRSVWALYKQLTGNKPLRDATREDGRKLVAHFEGQGTKSATIRKKVGWLTAAINLAIREGRLKFNPFASIVPKRDDSETRLPLDDADMKVIKRKLHRLGESDQLLLRLLASTGMRLSEAFEVDSEATERGIRYVVVGHKTPQSKRRVPLPAAALPFLPKVIKGALFAGSVPAASKRLNRFLRDAGIADRAKVVHSLRHRAQDCLRAAECPQDIRWALLGHEEKSVAAGYGEGFAVPVLRKWIDRIGF